MPVQKDNTTKAFSQTPKYRPLLSNAEVDRLASKLAVELECDEDRISLLLLLLNHLERAQSSPIDFDSALLAIKQRLFTGTSAAERAQEQFEKSARLAKGKLLLWPFEQK